MHRAEGIRALLSRVTTEPIIANLGPATFDLFTLGNRAANLYTWGGMGLVSSLGLGVALAAPDRKVIVMDGDGSLLMNLGSLATIARQRPPNLVHLVWDNHQWAETGGQPTHTATGTDLAAVARAAGVPRVEAVRTLEELEQSLDRAFQEDGPWCIVAEVEERGRSPRPAVEHEANLALFRSTFQSQ